MIKFYLKKTNLYI